MEQKMEKLNRYFEEKIAGCGQREVNIIIADYFDDFCTIRRDMISENLPDRDAGKYWRVKAKE